MSFHDNPQNILGANTADNQYDSSEVVANKDGSMIERLEHIKDVVSGADSTDNPIGANDADNGFDSSLVAANENGSVLERLEAIKDQVVAADALLDVPTEDLATDETINQVVGKKSDTTAGTSLVALLKQTLAAIAVPTEDLATDSLIAQVVGKKSDTVAGTSLVALLKQVLAAITAVDDYVDTEIAAIITKLVKATGDEATDDTIAQVIGIKADTVAGTSIVSLLKQTLAALLVNFNILNGTTASTTAVKREAGRTQIKTISITSAANAGAVTLATVTTQSCIIKSIVIRSEGATTADLTSAAVSGGAAGVLVMISSGTATQAALNAADKQVSFSGVRVIPATGTISMDLQGTGATAVALKATIEYYSTVDGGYLA